MIKKTYTGINIQFPISQLILSGKKTIETRTYPLPLKYLGQDMLLIETSGKNEKFSARIIAIIRFSNCHKYKNSKEFYKDTKAHFVSPESPWAWKDDKPKWGWTVEVVGRLPPQQVTKKKGIIYTSSISI